MVVQSYPEPEKPKIIYVYIYRERERERERERYLIYICIYTCIYIYIYMSTSICRYVYLTPETRWQVLVWPASQTIVAKRAVRTYQPLLTLQVRLNTQHSTINTQHSIINTQHSTLNNQHSTLSAQHSILVRPAPAPPPPIYVHTLYIHHNGASPGRPANPRPLKHETETSFGVQFMRRYKACPLCAR